MSFLDGKRVALTGRLGSMTRREGAELIRSHGGTVVQTVTRRTHLLVLGAEGWPLCKDGSLPQKLRAAQAIQAGGGAIAIMPENELLQQLNLAKSEGVHRRFTLAELGSLLNIPRDRLRSWMRSGLLQPVETVQNVCFFDYQQVTRVRTLWELTLAGAKIETIRRSLEQLARWLPGADDSLAMLGQDGRLFFRLDEGLVDAKGQLHFDFEESPALAYSPVDGWERGCELEEAGRWTEAVQAYRDALLREGPAAPLCFNLANVLYRLGELGAAAERFRQAVELDNGFAQAWNNLGNVELELGNSKESLAAYRRALHEDPDFADAHYNLADALDAMGNYAEAQRHWREYLRQESVGEWAEHARRRCRAANRPVT